MGRPAVMGRQLLYQNNQLIGICLGMGGYNEHNFSSLEDGVAFVQKLNFSSSNSKESRKDLKLIKKLMVQNRGTVYPQVVNFIASPHLNVYTRSITINNNTFKGSPALVDGNYYILAIESEISTDILKRYFNERLGNRRVFAESDILQSNDYNSSCFHSKDLFIGTYSNSSSFIWFLCDREHYGYLPNLIEDTLKRGYLAVIPNAFGKYPGLSLIFVDKLMKAS